MKILTSGSFGAKVLRQQD